MKSVTVFSQAAITNFAITKDLFDVAEWVFHFGPGTGLELFGFQFTFIHRLASTRAFGNEPRDVFAILMLIPLLNSEITGITKYALLLTVKKVACGHDVVDVGCRGIDAMDQAKRVIHTNVHLHSEVPLVTFSGLVHLRITLAALILGGARRRDNGGVDNAAFTQHQAVFLQVLVHFFEQRFAQTMALQKMSELKDGGFVRQTVQLQARKVSHGFDLVQGVFHGRVTEIIKELHAVNAQHCRQRVRWPTGLALGVIAGYFLLQLLPGNQFVHPFQKDLATSLALLALVFGFGEGDLTHGGGESYPVDDDRIIADSGDLFRGSLDFESRYDRVSYASPNIGSMNLVASAGRKSDMIYEVGVTQSAEYDFGKIAAGVGFSQEKVSGVDDNETLGGSASVLFENGLNAALSYSELSDASDKDSKNIAIQFGYKSGKHATSIDYGITEDLHVKGDDGEVVSINYVYKPAPWIELYASGRQFTLDRANTDYDDVVALLAGSRIKF